MTRRSLAKLLAVRSDRGSVAAPPDTVSTGFLEQTAKGLVPVTDSAVIEAALSILAARVAAGPVLESPRAVREYLVTRLADLQHEVFGVIALNNRHRVIDCVELFRGTCDGCSVHPMQVCKYVLSKNAAAVILFHNHPSSVNDASQADELITKRLREALSYLDVRVLDHLIVGGREVFSFAERGLI